jgi:hypothetical protein
MKSDHEIGIATYEWGRTDYSHASFYAASGDSEMDIFKCVENGKVYVPCENELFEYNDSPVSLKNIEEKYAEAALNRKCANAIDAAVSAVRTPGEMAGTATFDLKAALKTLISEFGSERVNAVLAAIVTNNSFDGRYSEANKKWAESIFNPPVDALRYCTVNTHPVVLDGLVSKARTAENTHEVKPPLLERLGKNKVRAEREKAERKNQPKMSKGAKKSEEEL